MAKASSTFYMDESGARQPDHAGAKLPEHGRDGFAFGGILVDDEHRVPVEVAVLVFKSRWPQIADTPLHSADIRSGHGDFKWPRRDRCERERFMNDLSETLLALPVPGIACVIDRPGYNARYQPVYGAKRGGFARRHSPLRWSAQQNIRWRAAEPCGSMSRRAARGRTGESGAISMNFTEPARGSTRPDPPATCRSTQRHTGHVFMTSKERPRIRC